MLPNCFTMPPAKAHKFPTVFFELEAKEQKRIRKNGMVCQQCAKPTNKPRKLTTEMVFKLLCAGIVPKITYHKLCTTCHAAFDVGSFTKRCVGTDVFTRAHEHTVG